MANGALSWFNMFDDGSITADTESSAAPVTNLFSPQGGYPWLSAFGVTTANIYLDSQPSISALKANASSGALADFTWSGDFAIWRGFGVFRTNLTPNATVRYRLGTTAGGGDVLDTGNLSGIVAMRNQHIYIHSTSLVARYLTITISDPSNPDNQLKVGMVYGGNVFVPNSNFSFSSARDKDSRSETVLSAGGYEYVRFFWNRRKWALSWDDLADTEVRDYLDVIDNYARMGYNVLFVPDYEDSPNVDSVYGLLKEPGPFSFARAGLSRYAWNAEITERL